MKKAFLLTIPLLISGCAAENDLLPVVERNHSQHRISETRAIKKAENMLQQISESKQTRSSMPEAKISYMTTTRTRSSSEEALPDTLLYIINFGDSEGFAVVSTDKRTRPIYAISDEGSIDLSDTTYNKGLKSFFDGVKIDYSSSIAVWPGDSVKPGLGSGDDYELSPYVFCTDIVYPMIPKPVRKWGQEAPFNASIRPNEYTNEPLVGCGAVGTGMIMTCFKHPQKYYGIPMDWDAITGEDYTNKAIADFLCELGKRNNLNMQYKAESYCTLDRIPITFNNYDYVNPVTYKAFDVEKVFLALKTSPILVASDVRNTTIGHIWAIDGRVNYSEYTSLLDPPTKLFHCVWGWDGIANGYFFFNNGFDSTNPYMHDYEDKGSGKGNLNFNGNTYYWGPFQKK